MKNKIIDVQEILYKEALRLDDDKMSEFANNRAAQQEFERATCIYNTSAGFIKTINANLSIIDRAKKSGVKYEVLMKDLGLIDED